jgi:hypothetical protein
MIAKNSLASSSEGDVRAAPLKARTPGRFDTEWLFEVLLYSLNTFIGVYMMVVAVYASRRIHQSGSADFN